jgi:hypothetical protein
MGRRIPLAAVALVALLAGCGGGGGSSGNGEADKSASQILADAKAAARNASSVHVHGTINTNGRPLKIDLRIDSSKGGKGTLTINGSNVDLVRIGDTAYIRGSEAFYRQVAGPAAAALLKGKWLKASAKTGDLASLADLTDMNTLFNEALKPEGTLVKGGESTVDGQKVIAVKDKNRGTLYVATTGDAFPIEIARPSGDAGGSVHFDDWNQAVDLQAPQGAIDLSKLGG